MKRWLVTIGDPKGCGPSLIAKSWSKLPVKYRNNIIVCGDINALSAAFKRAKIKTPTDQIIVTSEYDKLSDIRAANVARLALEEAIRQFKQNNVEAIITAPVNKWRLKKVIPGFSGQTEWLSSKLNGKTTMMFCPPLWKKGDFPIIFLATTHYSLKDVSSAFNSRTILQKIISAKEHFIKRGIKKPKIAILGLNPHAGESTELGNEERVLMSPAIKVAKRRTIRIDGPFSADSFFIDQYKEYDGVVAMYHDQGLIPAKLMWKYNAVNVTLGLPIIRTSPGHGTAETLNFKEINPRGMIAAIKVAIELTNNNKI